MSDRLPEPTDVGPIAGGSIRASDADREQVTTLLNTAYAEGRITVEEHDERVTQVLTARTFDDLLPITSDLVAVAPATTVSAPSTSSSITVDTRSANTEPDQMIAIFGGVTRTGRWRVRRHIRALAVFGGMDLDMRDAVFESPLVELSGFWCFGGLDVKVPAGIEVRDQTAGVFGGTDIRDLGDVEPGAPVLVIKGLTLFGGVNVRGPTVRPPRKRWLG